METQLNVVLSGLMLVGVLGGVNAAEAQDPFVRRYYDLNVTKVASPAVQDYSRQVDIKYHRRYRDYMRRSSLGAQIVKFAVDNLGLKVGGGECTNLVEAALAAAGAKPGSNYVWGTDITGQAMQPGDIIQFEGCRFETANSWFEMPHHTAIVETASGTSVSLLHQNFGSQTVVRTALDLGWKVSGYYTVYRPTK